MTDNELLAKNVFGEITLGEVFKRFEKNLGAIRAENSRGADFFNTSWFEDDGELIGRGEYEFDFVFDMKAKVKVLEDHVELEDGNGTTWFLSFYCPVNFGGLVPGGKT